MVAILKLILYFIGSQWSCDNASVVLSYLDFLRVSFAHIDCTVCKCKLFYREVHSIEHWHNPGD